MELYRQHLSEPSTRYFIKEEDSCLVSFANDPGDNLLNVQVRSWEPEHNFKLIEKLEDYRKKILDVCDENYSFKRLNFMEQEAVTVFLKKDTILGFCTAWHREFYPSQTARILNRFWFDHSLRRALSRTVLRWPILVAIEHQCSILKNKGFQWAFISRPSSSERWIREVKKKLNEQSFIKRWEISDGYVLVCPENNDPSCWQEVVFGKLNGHNSDFTLLKNKLSKGAFIEKFKKKK